MYSEPRPEQIEEVGQNQKQSELRTSWSIIG